MNERVVEILVYIMSEIKDRQGKLDKIDSISKDLLQRGYTQGEINAALSWLFEKLKPNTEEILHKTDFHLSGSFRILHDAERAVITPKAYGYLIQLKELGLIDLSEMEQIIERAMTIGSNSIDEEEMKTIVASLLFDSEYSNIDNSFLIMDKQNIIH